MAEGDILGSDINKTANTDFTSVPALPIAVGKTFSFGTVVAEIISTFHVAAVFFGNPCQVIAPDKRGEAMLFSFLVDLCVYALGEVFCRNGGFGFLSLCCRVGMRGADDKGRYEYY